MTTPNPRGMPTDTRYLYEPRDLTVSPHWSWSAEQSRKTAAEKAAKTRSAKRAQENMKLLFG